ncbi:hypothetical protein GBA52_020538 [Prunus armeniaca]|nr:hypothetical protein GBA52_020538 [Prunus armeniaca]
MQGSLRKKLSPPSVVDWEYAKVFVKFLKRFYETTLKLRAYKTVTSHVAFHEMCSIVDLLTKMMASENPFMKKVATSMKSMYDKYWGNIGDVNQLPIVAVVLDPRYKVDYVHISFGDLEKDASKVNAMISGVKDLVMKLYEAYRKEDPAVAQAYVEANVEGAEETSIVDSDERLEKFMRSRKEKHVVQIENEVDKYLLDPPENPKNVGFNLLDWWKENHPRFPVSSVPSKAAFSAGKRVVDPFRASLTPKTMETLICSND